MLVQEIPYKKKLFAGPVLMPVTVIQMLNNNKGDKQLVHNHLIYYQVAAEIMYLEDIFLKK